jgi:hypothetical protein
MNLRKMGRLVQQLKEEMHNGAHRAQAARLAKEYHELCEVNLHRLEQSASMVESNNIVGAVQLANQSPPLMEVLIVLNFDKIESWRDYCRKNSLPEPPQFDEDSIKILTHALKNEDEIGPSHPLSREYARLMIDRNLPDAFGVLRAILEKDPGNQAAAQAMPGLERGILELKSRQLAEALNESNNEQAIRIAEETEELPFFEAEHLDNWIQVKTLQVEDWLIKVSAAINEDDWQKCASLMDNVSQARSHVAGLNLSEGQKIFIEQATDWVKAKETEWLLEQEYREALKQLEMVLMQRERDRVMNASLSLKMLREASSELNARWQAVQDLEKPVPNEIIARVDRERSALLWDIQEKEKGRMRVMMSTAAVFVVLCAFMVMCLVSYNSGKALRTNLKVAMKERKVQAAEDYLNGVALIGVKKLLVAGLGETMNEAKSFVTKEKGNLKAAEEFVRNLIGKKDSDFKSVNLAQASDIQNFASELSSASNKVEALAPEYKSKLQDNLAIIQNAWGSQIEEKRAEIHGGYLDLLAKMEKLKMGKLQPYRGPELVREGLDEMKPLLAKWKQDTLTWGFQTFRPSPAHESRRNDIQQAVSRYEQEYGDWVSILNMIEVKAAGKILPEYLTALETLQNNLLLPRTIKSELTTIKRLGITLDGMHRYYLAPPQFDKDPNFLAKLRRPLSLRPVAPTRSAVVFLKDSILDNTEVNCEVAYVYKKLSGKPIAGTGIILYIKPAQPPFGFDKEYEMHIWGKDSQGRVLNYQKNTFKTNPVAGDSRIVYVHDKEYSKYRDQNELIDDSEIADLFDQKNAKWDGDVLTCLDLLNKIAAKDVNDGFVSKKIGQQPNGVPVKGTRNLRLFAYLANTLYELMDEQQGEWGLEWSPQAQKDRASLISKKIQAHKLQSGDWMIFATADPDVYAASKEHFLKASKISYKMEAKAYHGLLKAAYANGRGIKFVGYQRIEPGKTEEWLKTARLGREIFGFNKKGPVLMYVRDVNGGYISQGGDPLTYTPLFGLSDDRKKLLESFKQDTDNRDYKEFMPALFKPGL